MNRWVFLTALSLWAASLFLGGIWAVQPWVFESSYWGGLGSQREHFEKAFPFHLTRFDRSSLRNHSEDITSERVPDPEEFDMFDWASRETTARFVLVFLIWLPLGFIAKWFLGQIMRGKRTWT